MSDLKFELPGGDSDWKAEAKREKEKLAAKQAAAAAKANSGAAAGPGTAASAAAPAATPGGAASNGAEALPPADFSTLVSTLASQALMSLGVSSDPRMRGVVAPEYARHAIDLLAVVHAKTSGNLDSEEQALLNATLYELRDTYVRVVQAVREQTIQNAGLAPRGAA